jgi:5'-nucleotidase
VKFPDSGFLGALLAASLLCASAVVAAPVTTIKLIALNDFHGHLDPQGWTEVPGGGIFPHSIRVPAGGAAYDATLVHRLQAQNPRSVVVGAGDLIGASPLTSAHFHDEPTIVFLNRLGLEFSSVGNHEFDHGRDELLRMQLGGCATPKDETSCAGGHFDGARFRYLAANVIDQATGKSLFPAYAIKTFDVDGKALRIGFIGLVLRQTPTMVMPSGVTGLRFTDEAQAANAAATELKAQGVHALVVLIHQGIETAGGYDDPACPLPRGDLLPILPQLDPAIAVVVSGHTHQAYICGTSAIGGASSRLVTSAGSYGRFVTDVDLDVDLASGSIVASRAHNRVVVNDTAPDPAPDLYPPLPPDAAVAALVADADTRVASLKNRVVGRIAGDFTRVPTAAGETTLGDLVADAQLEATRVPEHGGAQIAMTNPGGLRTDLSTAPASAGRAVTYGEVFAAQPFGNTLVTLTLTGAQIHALLEQQGRRPNALPLQVSKGFSYAWDAAAAVGQRVDPASIRLDGEALAADRNYRVTVNSFLADGGDAFTVFRQAAERRESSLLDADALASYLSSHEPAAPAATDRIARKH